MKSQTLKILTSHIIGWFIGSIIWTIASSNNPAKVDFIANSDISYIIMFIITWLIQGIAYGFLFIGVDRYLKNKVTFLKLQVYAIVLQFLLACLLILLVFSVFKASGIIHSDISVLGFLGRFDGMWLAFIYALLVNFTINLFMYIDTTLGKGNLLKMIRGDFYTPKEQQQVFMFIDMKDSTRNAEQLGHIKYSQLIQDCFQDLAVVDRFQAEIYQYVGDEAVLTWSLEKAKDNNCVQAFYAFKDRLQERTTHYENQYGIIPTFKAGLHYGIITITEVGALKKEIAYHGDTINIAARLQGECNRLGVDLVISEDILKIIKLSPDLYTTFQEKVSLRGKKENTPIYSLHRT